MGTRRGMFSRARVVLGVALVWGALGVLGFRLGWENHSQRADSALVRSARSVARATGTAKGCTVGAAAAPTADGQLTGVLEIPKLGVTAPVEEGTGDQVLDVAVGHADSTPLPGMPGSSVLLAHDVSYFADIDQLSPGDELRYQAGCVTYAFDVVSHQVVPAGSAVPQVAGDSVVLDTCWPTDALWFTPDRYLVEAVETSARTATGDVGTGRTWQTGYASLAPPPLLAQGLDLTDNEEPMGTLTVSGPADKAWVQSPAPLALEAAALQAYFGAVHAAAQDRAEWWNDVAPAVAMPVALGGSQVVEHDSPLNVTIAVDGDTPTTVVLQTVSTLAGGADPGRYDEQVTESVTGMTVAISSWEVQHD